MLGKRVRHGCCGSGCFAVSQQEATAVPAAWGSRRNGAGFGRGSRFVDNGDQRYRWKRPYGSPVRLEPLVVAVFRITLG